MSIYRPKTSRFYWCELTFTGQRIRQSTGKTDRREAKAFELQLKAQLAAALPSIERRRGVKTLRFLADRDLARAQGTSDHNKKTLKQRWLRTIKKIGDVDPYSVTLTKLKEYVAQRFKEEAAGQTIRRELADIRRALLEAKQEGWIEVLPEPWPTLRNAPKNAAQSGKIHSDETIEKVLAEVPLDVREACLFVKYTALRFQELKRVRYSWVKHVDGVRVLHLPPEATKSKRERMIGLSEEAHQLLLTRWLRLDKADALFPRAGYRKALWRACRELELGTTLTLRDLRHGWATTKLEETGDIASIAYLLGHAKISTTAEYLHVKASRAIRLATVVRVEDTHTEPPHQNSEEKKLSKGVGLGRFELPTPRLSSVGTRESPTLYPHWAGEKCIEMAGDAPIVPIQDTHTEEVGNWAQVGCSSCGELVVVEIAEKDWRCPVCERKIQKDGRSITLV